MERGKNSKNNAREQRVREKRKGRTKEKEEGKQKKGKKKIRNAREWTWTRK